MLEDQDAGELTEAVDERLARLRELAARRAASRKATRERLARRRAYGLAERHQAKLDRVKENDQMAKRPCIDCGVLADTTRCASCRRAKDREREAMRPSPAARGYGAAWRKLRDQVIAEEVVCRWCGTCGDVGNPLTVDHVVPKSRGGTDDRENLRVLCKRCHGTKPTRERREQGETPGGGGAS